MRGLMSIKNLGSTLMKFSQLSILVLVSILLGLIISFQGCGNSNSTSGGGGNDPNTNDNTQTNTSTQLTFERLKSSPNGQSFKIKLRRQNITPSFVTSMTVTRAGANIGQVSTWTQVDANTIESKVTPDSAKPTGRYKVLIQTVDGQTFDRTPIVLSYVNDRWNQPELIGGYVNTAGWEDSPQTFVTQDANGKESLYIAFMYFPIRFNCKNPSPTSGRSPSNPNDPLCTHPIGPYTAPERPNLTIASFISGGVIDQRLPHLAANFIGAAKSGAMFYLYKVNSDGYPGFLGTPNPNPMTLFFHNDDGYAVNAGPHFFKNGDRYSVMYNNVNFMQGVAGCPGSNSQTAQDIYVLNNFNFNVSTTQMGYFQYVLPGTQFSNGSTNTGSNGCPELVLSNHLANGFPTTGTQSNPSVYFPNDQRPVVLWDQESAPGSPGSLKMIRLNVGGTFPMGPWTEVNMPILDAPTSNPVDHAEKTQPVLTDKEFCFHVRHDVQCAPYNGGDPSSPASYGPPVQQLAGTNWMSGSPAVGEITSVAEPSPFTYQGQNCMSFDIAEISELGDIDMNLGIAWVCE